MSQAHDATSDRTPEGELNDEQRRILERLEHLSRLLDSAFELPLIRYRVGLDAIVGLIPGVGDVLGALPSLYIIYQALKLELPTGVLVRMLLNLIPEVLIGSVPLVGDIFDAVWKANDRNLYLIKRHLGTVNEDDDDGPPSNEGLYIFLAAAFAMLVIFVVLVVRLLAWLFGLLL